MAKKTKKIVAVEHDPYADDNELQCEDCGEAFTVKRARYNDDDGQTAYECPECGGINLTDVEINKPFKG